MIKFTDKGHLYESTGDAKIDWKSVTRVISKCKQPFDPIERSKKSSKNKKSVWYGMDPQEIRSTWKGINDYALKLGNWYHPIKELEYLSQDSVVQGGIQMAIQPPIIEGEYKYSPPQKLENNTIYPEHFIYLESAQICGQADRVEVFDWTVNINDYKTNKEIKQESYRSWDGSYTMMLAPLEHLMDCNYYHYGLQLSLYMYMIIKHNPKLKPGKLTLEHVIFEEEGRDKYGGPIYVQDENGDFKISKIMYYEVPYLKTEVKALIALMTA